MDETNSLGLLFDAGAEHVEIRHPGFTSEWGSAATFPLPEGGAIEVSVEGSSLKDTLRRLVGRCGQVPR